MPAAIIKSLKYSFAGQYTMDVAYLLFKDGIFSLPMSGYDSGLFHSIAGCSRTRFDLPSRTFYIENMEAVRADIKKAIGKRVYVMADETTGSVHVQNFFSREWKCGVSNETPYSTTVSAGCAVSYLKPRKI